MSLQINLHGKIAVITGATGQLGRVMARTLAQAGADIAVHYARNADMAMQLVEEIRVMRDADGTPRRAIAVQADITNEADVQRMAEEIRASLGDPDIVVNNAVIQYDWQSVLDQPLSDFQSQFDSCVMQSVLTARAFLPAMRAKKHGRFIGINTECSALCNANTAAYAAAKSGMTALYRVLAKEVGGDNITVNQVSPGWTISDRDRADGTEVAPDYSSKIPLKRRGTDAEIAHAVAFLASDLAGYITGVNLPVCGGAVMV
ncbi:MAG: SDR family oxidoreductase [Defluviitaleaceae bacterium]|nr:SDR family oxidoreductase [Defluviitaleaceae bacterium]